MDELVRLLKISGGPLSDGVDLVKIKCSYEFEPFGRASETWELMWRLDLPTVQAYWRSVVGYRTCDEGLHPHFTGHTLEEVVNEAVVFLKECPESVLKVEKVRGH